MRRCKAIAYVGDQKIIKVFRAYLNKYYSECTEAFPDEGDGFPDVYKCDAPYLCKKYLDNVEIAGNPYMRFVCWVNMAQYHFLFEMLGDDVPCLPYIEYVKDDKQNATVGDHMKAEKLFEIVDVDRSAFPKWVHVLSDKDVKTLL